jgi:hypothetical protein
MKRLVLVAGLAALLVPGVARASTGTTDVAIVKKAVSATSATDGTVVAFKFWGEDLGPDAVQSSLDVGIGCPPGDSTCGARITGAVLTREICAEGVSPDTPDCEYGPTGAGVSLKTVIRARITGSPGTYAKVRTCAWTEDPTQDSDSNLSNNCKTLRVFISG